MRYAIVVEKAESNYGAYVPDLPGCVTAGRTLDEVRAMAIDALALHLQGLIEDGSPIPEPSVIVLAGLALLLFVPRAPRP